MTSKKEFRTWKNPKAEQQYQRQAAAKQRQTDKQVNDMAERVLDALDTHQCIVAYGMGELLIKLAQASGVRLFDDGIDGKLAGYAKRLGGERYRAIKAALYHIVDIYDDVELLIDRDSMVHTLQLVSAAHQSARARTVIDEDGRIHLSDCHRALLLSWQEEEDQYV